MKAPRLYQNKGEAFLALRDGAILGDEPGLGKTFTSLLAVRTAKATNVLIVCPLPLKYWWAQEIKDVELADRIEVESNPHHWSVDVFKYGRVIRTYTLAHYQQFRDGPPKQVGKKKVRQYSHLCQPYLTTTWDAVVADECHHIKNRQAQRAFWMGKLRTSHRWGLTGTPLAETPYDLWSVLNWIKPKDFTSYWRFVAQYWEETTGYDTRGGTYKKIAGLKWGIDPLTGRYSTDVTLRTLQEHLKPYLLVRRLEDVGVELPPLTITDLPLEMSSEQREFYDEVKHKVVIELCQEMDETDVWKLDGTNQLVINSVIARFTRLNQAASAPTVFTDVPNTKLDWLKEHAQGGEPCVIMSRFNHTVNEVNKVLAKAKRTDFVVGTYGKLSEGHNLQQYNHIVCWDAPQSRLQWEQAYHRVHRLGQERPQRITRLKAAGTIDEHCWRLIDRKEDNVAEVLAWLRDVQ